MPLDDVILIAEAFVKDLELFASPHNSSRPPNKLYWIFDKTILSNELFKKLKGVEKIEIDASFREGNWYIHFNPVVAKR